MQTYGCERCGRHSERLRLASSRPRARCSRATVVHLHADKNRPAPFTIVKVALDDGPVIRTLLAEDSAPVAPGQRVTAGSLRSDERSGETRARSPLQHRILIGPEV